jgi:pyruvate,water dikinase
MVASSDNVIWFEKLKRTDVGVVGGKNASLGEMIRELTKLGIKVPPGFATTADAFRKYVSHNKLDQVLDDYLDRLERGPADLSEVGSAIRRAFVAGEWPSDIESEITEYFDALGEKSKGELAVAVRSSATAEDLPDASFAGQQETYLNVRGPRDLLDTCRRCYASLFTDRAITYRQLKGFDHKQVALSIGVQQMVRSDIGGSGVMFSIDTESGFDKVVLINAAWGLGENVVQGSINPDEYQVFKPFLNDAKLSPIVEKRVGEKEKKMIYGGSSSSQTINVPTSKKERQAFVLKDDEILSLARQAAIIEKHYEQPMDMEWARDGITGELFIVQARPETVQARADVHAMKSYSIDASGPPILSGLSIGNAVTTGPVCVIEDARDIDKFVDGSVLVTSTTDPDWVPIMKRAAAIVTDHGGRTSHAAIVSRELGIPAIVGTGEATHVLHEQQEITVSCCGGEKGEIYQGSVDFKVAEIKLDHIPQTRTKIMLNLANPSAAFRWWRLPVDGVGLARMEFVINSAVQVHPMALAHYSEVRNEDDKKAIEALTQGYGDKCDYFVETLSRGLSRIAAVVHPAPVIVRMSDFKTNEYAKLLGGTQFEPTEENPMIGLRGASRYYADIYRDGFALECKAIHRLREVMGFSNVLVMVPFCRSPQEADKVLKVMADNGLKPGSAELEIYMMCEVPSNVILAEEFAKRFSGFSIGSNDLTQLTLGADRDNEDLAALFDEQNPAVLWMIKSAIEGARAAGIEIGFCGQAPSNDPVFARFLVDAGIDSISVTPDSFLAVKTQVANAEKSLDQM